MASAKLLTVASLTAASISVMAFAGCQPSSPTAPTTPGGISLDPITPPSMDPLPTDEPSDEPYEPGDEPFEPEPGDEEPTEPQEPTGTGTVTGWVYDDGGNKLDGVTITAKTLSSGTFANGSDTVVVTTTQGYYTLEGAPSGVTIYVRATKSGYTTRQQTIVPEPGSDTAANALSFGDPAKDPGLIYALSNKPEVVSFTPQAATGVDPATSFTLTFSTAVRPADVVENFAVYVAGTAGGSHALTTPGVSLTHRFDPAKDIGGSGNGYSAVIPSTGAFIYDAKSSMDATWSNGNRTVTFEFKPGIQLPTDKAAGKVPQYAMSFKGGTIYDASGTYGRSDFWFRTGAALANRVGVSFTVASDTAAPQLQSVTAINKNDVAGQNTDEILAKFSEPMVLFPNDQEGKSIPRDAAGSGYALLPKMFKYFVSSAGTAALPDGGSSLPGGFAFDGLSSPSSGFLPFAAAEWDDSSNATVKLVPLSNSPNGSGKGWKDDTVASSGTGTITVTSGVTDLNVGDLLQSGTSVYRATEIDADSKTISVTQYGTDPAPANGQGIGYWKAKTTNATSASTGISFLWLDSVIGLRKGDSLSVPIDNEPTQVVTLTENPNPAVNNIVRFAPALNGHVAIGRTVTFVSPLSAGHTGFGLNQTVWLGVNPAVTDPAGNAVSTAGNGHIKSVTSSAI